MPRIDWRAWVSPKDFESTVLVSLGAMAVVLMVAASLSARKDEHLPTMSARMAVHTTVDELSPDEIGQVRRTGRVSAVTVRRLPPGWDGSLSPPQRKAVFAAAVLPLILAENTRIRETRRRMIALLGSTNRRPGDQRWLTSLAKRYGVDEGALSELTRRVDTVPPSVALTQAAVESAWGTSRFAIEGNALFGQWTTASGTGLVPSLRDAGASHKVRKYPSLAHSVASYMHNLNTHRAYTGFRARRWYARQARRWVDAHDYAADLAAYSQRRQHYVDTLRRVLRDNRMTDFDTVRLKP